MDQYVFVYSRPGQPAVTQLPPPYRYTSKHRFTFEEAYLDYLYAVMSLARFVFLGLG